jgi:hypothetical protein
MAMFDYVMVLASVIIGLGVTQLLQGVATVIQHPERKRAYWVHLIWVAFIFFNTVFWWWWQFSYRGVETWTFPLYLFVILYAVVMYINCAMLIPADMDGYADFKDFFYSRRRWIFGALIVFLVMDLVDTSLKGSAHFANLGPEYPLRIAGYGALCLAGAITRNQRFHATAALLGIAYQVTWAIRYFATVN